VDHAVLQHGLPLVLDSLYLEIGSSTPGSSLPGVEEAYFIVYAENNIDLAFCLSILALITQLIITIIQVGVYDLISGKQPSGIWFGFNQWFEIVVGMVGLSYKLADVASRRKRSLTAPPRIRKTSSTGSAFTFTPPC
jgi:hypothetical protein